MIVLILVTFSLLEKHYINECYLNKEEIHDFSPTINSQKSTRTFQTSSFKNGLLGGLFVYNLPNGY